MIATAHGAVWIIEVLIVLGCVIAAAWCGFRGLVLPCVLLLVVAIVAAVLLFGA